MVLFRSQLRITDPGAGCITGKLSHIAFSRISGTHAAGKGRLNTVVIIQAVSPAHKTTHVIFISGFALICSAACHLPDFIRSFGAHT